MSDILMTNIFFMITAISSVVITIVLVIALIYIIKLVKKLNRISQAVEDETLRVISDVEEVRGVIKEQVKMVKNVTSAVFIRNLIEKIFTSRKK